MAKLELSRELAVAPDVAWERASDLSGLGDWLVMHQGWRCDLPDELTVGTTLVGVAGAKGMRNRVTWTVREMDPPKLLAITGEGVGGTKYALKMAVRPARSGSGSKFDLTIELGGRPLFGPIGIAATRAVKGDIERSMKKFEELYS
jgi:uncharacterized protein YndB with AHSA1/START domain